MTEDEQEALSIYQALGLRLCLLTSGNWAVVIGPGQVEIMEHLDMERLRVLAEAERLAWEQARAKAAILISMVVGKTDATLEELGL